MQPPPRLSVSSRKGEVHEGSLPGALHPLQLWRFPWHWELPSTSLKHVKAYATHLNGLPRLRRTWLDLPSVTTSATSVVGVISEAIGPGRTGGPTSARIPGSLALWTPFCLPKAETVLHLRVDRPLCLNSPLVVAASTSIVGVVSKWFRPCRTVAPATARVRRSLTLRAAFSFFKADPKTPLTSPANWRPADD